MTRYLTTGPICVDGVKYAPGDPIDPPAGSLDAMLRMKQIVRRQEGRAEASTTARTAGRRGEKATGQESQQTIATRSVSEGSSPSTSPAS